MSDKSIVQARAAFAEHAKHLAGAAAGVTVHAGQPAAGVARKFTTVAWFFEAGDRLVVVSGPCDGLEPDAEDAEARRTTREPDLALAYGLAHAGGRPLTVVLPKVTSHPTLVRAPWLTDVDVFTYDFDSVVHGKGYGSLATADAQAPDETLAAYRAAQPNEAEHLGEDFSLAFLGQRAQLVLPLLRWLDSDPTLVPAHRQSYLAWHCEGRMVLRIKRGRGGTLVVSAGVHTPTVHTVTIDQNSSPAAFYRLIEHAAGATADRLDGTDRGHGEHRIQARILEHMGDIGVDDPRREYPAWRPSNDPERPSRAFIDFLGRDDQERLRVVETKIGNDEMLVLQGLDYWIWANANADLLAQRFGVQPGAVHVDFVCAAKGKAAAIGPYSANQAGRLHPSVSHRFYRVDGWEGKNPTFTEVASQQS